LLLIIFVPRIYAQNTIMGTGASPASTVRTATDAATKLKDQLNLIKQKQGVAIAQARGNFEAQLKTIKDQRKKTLTQRIDAKLAEINKKFTARYSETLTAYQQLLDQGSRSLSINSSASTDVQKAIDLAKIAVEAQAAKIYTMNIVDDITLKQNAGTTVSQLRQDLTSVYKLVVDVKVMYAKFNSGAITEEKTSTESANL
jgi:hypothetical protein